MAEIAPLTPLRYDLSRLGPEGLSAVVAPPYDVIDAEQRAELAARDPRNIVRAILPEGDVDVKYNHAASLLREWRRDGTLVRDEVPGYYRYDQTFTPPGGGATITRRGFFALVKLVPLDEGIVLPHERTLRGPKEDRLRLFRATRTNLSPGFMLYRDPGKTLDEALQKATPLATFTTADGVEHAVSKISDPDAVAKITRGVAASSLLIADGHHRYETALFYSREVEASLPSPSSPRAEHRYFMVFLTNGDDPDLVVFPTHRHVHSLGRFDFEDLLAGAGALFDVTTLPPGASAEVLQEALREAGTQRPSLVACAGDGRAALFSLRPDVDLAAHPVLGEVPAALRGTDVALLHMGILEPVLGITKEAQAAKTNLWYVQDTAVALRAVRGGSGADKTGQVLFLMNATPVRDVRAVAEAGEVMPQKSTFFYPKVWTGVALHTLEPEREVALVDR